MSNQSEQSVQWIPLTIEEIDRGIRMGLLSPAYYDMPEKAVKAVRELQEAQS